MRTSVLLYTLILSSSITLRIKCNDVEISSIAPESSASNVSDTDTEVFMYLINGINDTEYNNKTGSNSTISLAEPFGLTIETRTKRDSSMNKSSATRAVNSTVNKLEKGAKDDSHDIQTSTVIEESIQEMFLEPWGRAKRETKEEDANSANKSTQEQDSNVPPSSSESIQDQNLDEFFSDHDVSVESGDASNESSKQLDPEESSSTSEEVREQRNIGQSEEIFQEGEYRHRTHPYWYRQPIIRRYWTSYERKPSRDFIKIPIFPGK